MSLAADINDYQITYNKIGNGPKIAVLVHGWGASKAWWQTMAEGLAQTHTCYVPDLLGFGESTKPNHRDAFHIEHQAETLAAFIKELNLEPVYLIGHSMGGMISVTLAHRYPKLVERLAVFNLVVTGRCGSILRWGQLTLSMPVIGRPLYAVGHSISTSTFTTYSQSLRLAFYHPDSSQVQDFLARTYPDLRTTPRRSFEFGLWAFTHFDLRPFMSQVQQPTLVICGQDDKQIPPEDSRMLAKSLPNARLECLTAAGHNPFVEYPRQCTSLLQGFANGAGHIN